MIDHVLGRPSVKSRRLQVLAVLAFWSAYAYKGDKHGPPPLRFLSRIVSRRLTAWQTVVVAMIYLYAARNFSTLAGIASPEPLANMYDPAYFRATWVLTALDAGFWTAMRIRTKWLRDLASIVFSLFYLFAAERADEKVRKVRGNLTVEHLRVSWDKGVASPYLRFMQGLLRPRSTRWPARAIRIPRPSTSDFKDAVAGWLYFDGPLSDLQHHSRVVLDLPGGGFVAMDPRANDDKLLAWAAKTGVPVLSIDYKKAPEHPYPYALNECYDVYASLVRSKGRCIGLSGAQAPTIVVTGDSAGGSLATAMTLMIIETGALPGRRFHGQMDLPVPAALLLFYPGLDMNIGSWMSDDQMALINDRRLRSTNSGVAKRKNRQYTDLVGTPAPSDGEDDGAAAKLSESDPPSQGDDDGGDKRDEEATQPATHAPSDPRSSAPEYAHSGPSAWTTSQLQPKTPLRDLPEPLPEGVAPVAVGGHGHKRQPSSASHHPEPLRTRLAMSSMISYFNDRVLTPEMMRAMIILYIGPRNRPDFSQDYLLSPILAPDVLLAKFPRTWFLTGERDPLVDDTVIFAGRLRRVKAALHASGGTRIEYRPGDERRNGGFDDKEAAQVVLIPGISHGFLQFPSIYPPAWTFFDRIAAWIEDAFHDAEKKRQGKRRAGVGLRASASAATEAVPTEATMRQKYHFRTESSGDEDRPLEMSMTTRARRRTVSSKHQDGAANKDSSPHTDDMDDEGGGSKHADEDATLEEVDGTDKGRDNRSNKVMSVLKKGDKSGARKSNGGKRRVRTRDENETLLVKLNSSDDLLGRRMQGLAGGLTGLMGDPV